MKRDEDERKQGDLPDAAKPPIKILFHHTKVSDTAGSPIRQDLSWQLVANVTEIEMTERRSLLQQFGVHERMWVWTRPEV